MILRFLSFILTLCNNADNSKNCVKKISLTDETRKFALCLLPQPTAFVVLQRSGLSVSLEFFLFEFFFPSEDPLVLVALEQASVVV